jgi:hypothetical protein
MGCKTIVVYNIDYYCGYYALEKLINENNIIEYIKYILMNLNKLSLTKNDRYWLYVLNGANLNDFINYDKPHFTIPNNEFIRNDEFQIGDIIILILSNKKCYNFIGFIQLSSMLINNKNGKVKIFKDTMLNANYVTIKFRLVCKNNVKLNDVLKSLKLKEDSFTTSSKFISKYAKKHIVMSELPKLEGKQLIKHLIMLNEKDEEDTDDDVETDTELTPTEPSTTNETDETKKEIREKGMIPIMIIPCPEFDIDIQKNKTKYFVDHYKKCYKCNVINNNNIELHTIINDCKFDFQEIKEVKNAYFNPPLDQYNFGMNYEPFDNEEFPFARIVYINNGHPVYNKCIMVCWIIDNF